MKGTTIFATDDACEFLALKFWDLIFVPIDDLNRRFSFRI